MNRQFGFTLIELVMVMVISAVIGVIAVQFIRTSTSAVIDTAGRQQLAASAAIINEQISRAMRDALPGSIRTTPDNRCIEYMPILAATSYTRLTTGNSVSSFQAVPYSSSHARTGHLSIYPLSDTNLYDLSNPGSITAVRGTLPAGNSEVTITLSTNHQFDHQSPVKRLYVSDTPITFCQQGSYLYRYSGYGFFSDVSNLVANLPDSFGDGREVVAFPLIADSMIFQVSPATLIKNGVVTFQYQLRNSRNNDILELAQEVHIRNVP